MLVEFSVNNFKSIKDTATFSMVSGSNNKMGNTTSVGKLELLPSAVIYGANASGKSNILEAFNMMRRIVLNEDKIIQSTDELPYNPFKLSTETEDSSTSFDVVFTVDGKKYKYGFEYDSNIVYSEYLIVYESVRPTTIFEFDRDSGYKPNIKISEIKGLKKLDNSLYLWKADQEGFAIAKTVLEWFKSCTFLANNIRENSLLYSYLMDKKNASKNITNLLKEADLGIKDIEKASNDKVVINGTTYENSLIKFIHQKYDEHNQPNGECKFDLENDESLGTRKYFYILQPIILTLFTGSLLILDEFDANLHPSLATSIIKLFNNKEVNKFNAQLIFTSQNTNFLTTELFHKSQIWFAEKDVYGGTHLASLLDYKNVKQNDNLEKNYIMGKYGAIPYIGNFNSLL